MLAGSSTMRSVRERYPTSFRGSREFGNSPDADIPADDEVRDGRADCARRGRSLRGSSMASESKKNKPAVEMQSAFARLSMGGLPASSRKDRSIAHAFKAVDARVPSDDLYWRRAVFSCPRAQFVCSQHAAVEAATTRSRLRMGPSDGHIALCQIHAGTYAVEQSDGRQYRFHAGQLFMLDCGRMMRSQRSDGRASYLRLPRSLIHEAMGRDPGVLGRIAFLLDHAQLAPFLQAQMAQLDMRGSALTPDALATILDATVDLAVDLIRAEFGSGTCDAGPPTEARLAVARRYIENNLHRHDLTPAEIARALNCSRAQLYRVFGEQSMSVGETIKEARLARSLRYLQAGSPQLSIGEIADMCGFSDQSAFGKQFRQRFAFTPSEARHASASVAAAA
ncbi:helix-turn-helix domain-containing protein [Burkholderia sp. MR1-5-21]